jgi:hypothetical protein
MLSKRKSFKNKTFLSSDLLKIKYSKCFFSFVSFLNLSISFPNNLIVASASFKALCAHSNQIQKELHNISKLSDDSLNDKKFAKKKVSIAILLRIFIQLFKKKSISKYTLCPKRGKSQIKLEISFFKSSKLGAQITSAS